MNSTTLLLVDGNNLLFKAREHLFKRVAGRGQVCAVLGAWSGRTGVPVLVVFDGEPPTRGVEKQFRALGVDIRFSRSRSADLVIEEIIAQWNTPAFLRVISSDKAIQSAARHRRCPCSSCEEFIHELAVGTEDGPKPAPSMERKESMTDDEVAKWMEDFGFDTAVKPVEDTDLMGPVEPLD